MLHVIGPLGVDGRTDLTTIPPLRALRLAGTTQALDCTQPVAVNLDGRISALPRPDLLGTPVIKASAAADERECG